MLAGQRNAPHEPLRHEGRQLSHDDRLAGEATGLVGLCFGVDDYQIRTAQQQRHQTRVGTAPLMRQDVVADHRRAGTTAVQGRNHRPIRNHLHRGDVREDDEVDLTQQPGGPDPAVGTVPRQRAGRRLERIKLRLLNGLLAWIQPLRVLP